MSLSRRDLISLKPSPEPGHIASLVVQCHPDKLEGLVVNLDRLAGVEIPVHDERGKLVVLLELADESQLLSRISEIETTPGVISATLVFHQIDD